MEDILILIFDGLSSVVSVSRKLTFSAFGFSLNWWDFSLSLMVVSVFLPLFFTLKPPQWHRLSKSSERNDKGGS